MSASDSFHGWACKGKDAPLEWTELPLKAFDADSVEMKISHCGICGSDIHTMDSGWGPTNYPCVVGHEIVGVATRVGENVKKFKVGDRIGVGAQSFSCLNCNNCKDGYENLCENGLIGTYNGKWPNGDKTFGGYADKWRGHQHFVFKVPDHMTNEIAATFFCAGVTTYAPLKRYNVKKGDRVGVVGLGGLGHFGVLWAKALGAEVVVLSHSSRKKQDAFDLGCNEFAATDEEYAKHRSSLTHILCTSYQQDFDWPKYLDLLKHNGTFILVAAPETALSGIPPFSLIFKQIQLSGSAIGSPAEIEEMLEFAEKHNVKPWINKYKMTDAPTAVQDFRNGKPRYRIVLEN
ncbi:chaperonin 10-like protein [Halteromyces radiatus]|uniref:chaperonin 10-like protein n=1 Tax=Halteromyces radiatus TaxID=101107 RepID=UPI00221EF528|nr:chaperonin 10-like protein [Halteromyces radiatus]KAI8098627.1 chaperonin 10-like protein [Halteromyces radiatus]